jgi:cell division protein FtsW (lipid II flippase)
MTADARHPIDRWLLLFALLLTVIGMVWVYSATGTRSGSAFVLKQGVSGMIGIALMLALSQVDLSHLRESPKILMAIYVIFLVLLSSVFLFEANNGAHRLIILFGNQIQPSEFFKPLSVLLTSWWMIRHSESWTKRQEAVPRLVTLFCMLALPLALILIEPDMGTTFLILFVAMLLIFLGGAPKWVFVAAAPVLLAATAYFIISEP